ncbi:uncharacterized protein DEA37_0015099, partial [Paragonimus westermani]
MLRIHKTRTTLHHPQNNGLVERTNRTEMTTLRAFIERHQSLTPLAPAECIRSPH